MEQQSVEIKFRGELVGSHTDDSAAYALYRVPGDVYVVHVDKGEESWLESQGGRGLNAEAVGTFFPELAAAAGLLD